MKRTLAFLLAFVMVAMALVGCNPKTGDGTESGDETENNNPGGQLQITEFDPSKKYTYNTSASTLPSGWNPHTYQTADDAVYFDYTTDSLYTLFYNEPNHPKEGVEDYNGYVIVPSMAADYPVDVTESVKKSHPQFNIPESATNGYAWSVKLRDDLKWNDGTPITAQDFVDSFERVLRAPLMNYRAPDYYTGSYVVVNAKNYGLAGYYDYDDNGAAETPVTLDQMEKDENGQYTYKGMPVFIGSGYALAWTGGDTLKDLYDYYLENAGIEMFDKAALDKLLEATDGHGTAICNDENLDLLKKIITFNPNWNETEAEVINYLLIANHQYDENYSFDNVGLYVSGDNELTFVYPNALDGFYLMTYGMTTQYLVKTDLYDKNLKEGTSAAGTVWTSTYGTSMDTSVSYGPYVMTEYQNGKLMHFSKNENWWGWTSDIYTYVDPEDNKTYRMYQTTDVDIQYVKEPATNKQMFLNGQLMTYSLQSEDFDQYRTSDYYFTTPAETIFFLLFNGYEKVINERENAADFDKNTKDLQTQMLESFKRACAVAIDRDRMAATVSPQRTGGYAFLGQTYIYDPETCAYYRDTDQAKQALVDFYSINLADYDNDLDKAVDAITGYDPETAKVKFQEAYQEALAKEYITDADNDGKSDQVVTMVYAMSGEVSDFYKKTFDFLNTSLNDAAKGTGFEGKINIEPSAPLGNGWSDAIRDGQYDTQLAGWSGATLDPFSMADTWTDSARSYWGNWWKAETIDLTIKIDGKDITMSVRDWALCLNGTMTTVDGTDYNFGYGQTSVENRLTILAEIEKVMLTSYNCVPIMQDGSGYLLSQKAFYVVKEYTPMMGRGGMQYMKYNFSDDEWTEYVSSQGGTLSY